jgi:membrane-bound lytic murein transglycosylase D
MDVFPQLAWDFMYPALLGLSFTATRECEFCEFNADYYVLHFIEENDVWSILKVQINETLGHYAEWAGIKSNQIRLLNNISSVIHMGQRIRVPVSGERARDFLKKRIEHHMSIEEDFFAFYSVTSMDTIYVKRGTTVWSLCRENEVPLWLFMKANQMAEDLRLDHKERILIPIIEEKG